MSRTAPSDTAMRVTELSQSGDNSFALRPDAAMSHQIAEELELSALRKLSFNGKVKPLGASDWTLEGTMGATVVQPCVVSLEPVTTRVDVQVQRQYISTYAHPDEPEIEMPEDDNVEPLGQWIDPAVVMIEALALAVPDYPRAAGAETGKMIFTKPGEAPMTDEDARPFAGLADFKQKLEKGGE
jgi:uncharacterized metal-binding protein YceD (DUF177 family)